MPKYRIAWLPGDGVGVDALKAAKIVLRRIQLDAEYVEGDIVTQESGQSILWRQLFTMANRGIFGGIKLCSPN